jgi:hypothetical protein
VLQLVDYDRHNNSLMKLRDKKEKSLSDEKNLFKVRSVAASLDYAIHCQSVCSWSRTSRLPPMNMTPSTQRSRRTCLVF